MQSGKLASWRASPALSVGCRRATVILVLEHRLVDLQLLNKVNVGGTLLSQVTLDHMFHTLLFQSVGNIIKRVLVGQCTQHLSNK